MNFEPDRRTKGVRIARSRSQTLSAPVNRTLRMNDMWLALPQAIVPQPWAGTEAA
jgi:hypothetical protein